MQLSFLDRMGIGKLGKLKHKIIFKGQGLIKRGLMTILKTRELVLSMNTTIGAAD